MNKLYIIAIMSIVGGFIGGAIMGIFNAGNLPIGSTVVGNEYKYLNTTNQTASTTTAYLVKTGPSVLGSVVFATTSSESIFFYDVAAAANYASTTLSTKIITFATGTSAGTYVLDIQTNKGLAMYLQSTSSEVIITYR